MTTAKKAPAKDEPRNIHRRILDIMADAYMGWDLEYALRMCRALAPFDMKWVEEPLLPDQLRVRNIDEQAVRELLAGQHRRPGVVQKRLVPNDDQVRLGDDPSLENWLRVDAGVGSHRGSTPLGTVKR